MENINPISQFIKLLFLSYGKIVENKKRILNHPKIFEYLFNKPIIKTSKFKEALDFANEYYIRKIILDNKDIIEIEGLFLIVWNDMERYIYIYRKYSVYISKYTSYKNPKIYLDKQLPFIPKKYPKYIHEILEKYNISYINQWSFLHEDHRNDAREIEPYSFGINLDLDFYCCLIRNNRMTQFAIDIYHHRSMFNPIKWYYLCQMNIHFLVLLPDIIDRISKIINVFINKIVDSDFPVLMGINYFADINCDIRLKLFYDNYMHNHITCVKYYKQHNNDETEDLKKLTNYVKNPDDTAYEIQFDFDKFISENTNIFTTS